MKLIFRLALLLIHLMHIGTSFKIGLDTYLKLAPLAAAERGYTGAVGGEALIAIVVSVIVYFVLDKLIYAVLEAAAYKIKK